MSLEGRYSALLVLVFAACNAGPDLAPDAASEDTHETRDAQVPSYDTSGGPICADETAYPSVRIDAACSLQAQSPDASAVDFDKLNLTLRIGGARVLTFTKVDDSAACGDLLAWHYDDANSPERLVLCAQACALALSDPDSQLQLVVGCDTRCAETDAGCAPPPA